MIVRILLMALVIGVIAFVILFCFNSRFRSFIHKQWKKIVAIILGVAICGSTTYTILESGEDLTPATDDNWWIYDALQPYEIYKVPRIDYTKYWNTFKNHAVWSLKMWQSSSNRWVDKTGLLNLNYTEVADNTMKVGLYYTTPNSPQQTDWIVNLTIDYILTSYINQSGDYEYTLNYTAWGEPFIVKFNWSDMLQYPDLIFNHSVIDGIFYFSIRKNDVPKNTLVEIDPEYVVYSGSAGLAYANTQHLVRLSNDSYYCVFFAGADVYVGYSWDGGETWGNTMIPDSDPYGTWRCSLCVDSNDDIHVIWSGYSNLDADDYHIRYCNNSNWNNVKNISYTDNEKYWECAIAVDSNDILHVVYERDDASDSEVEYLNSTDNGDTWGTPVTLTSESSIDDDTWMPAIAVNSTDSLHVVFSCEDHSVKDAILHMQSDDSGNTWSGWEADVVLDTNDDERYPSICITDDDDLIVMGSDIAADIFYRFNGSSDSSWSNGDTTEEIFEESSNLGGISVTDNDTIRYFKSYYQDTTQLIHFRNTTEDNNWDFYETIITGGGAMNDPCTVSTQWPVIGGVKTNRPKTGFALVVSNGSSNLIFFKSSDLTWDTPSVGNNPPTQSGNSPINGSTNIDLNTNLYVVVSDVDGDTLNATWWSNSSGTWVKFASNETSFASGTNITQVNTNFSDYSTKYWWSVNATDGEGGWSNVTYDFTTRALTWYLISSDKNGSWTNTTTYQLISSDKNGSWVNTTIYQLISSDKNGSWVNTTIYQLVSSDKNGTWTNTTTYHLISSDKNGTWTNETGELNWVLISNDKNGTWTNVTTYQLISNDKNGSWINTTIYQLISSDKNGSWTNVTAYQLISSDKNGTWRNVTTYQLISNDKNGTWTNYTAELNWALISNDKNGSWINTTSYQLISNDKNGSWVNVTLHQLISNDKNGSWTNTTTYQLISSDKNGTWTNTTIHTLISDDKNGTWTNTTVVLDWTLISSDKNGSWVNITTHQLISNDKNGTWTNVSGLDIYILGIRNTGIDYFIWLGDNGSAWDVAQVISGFDEDAETIRVWRNLTWSTTDGCWIEYTGTGNGTNFSINTFDVVEVTLTDSGTQDISMTENGDIDYDAARTIPLMDADYNKGYNYTGYTSTVSNTLKGIADNNITMSNGEFIAVWDNLTYIWKFYVQGFPGGSPNEAVSRWKVLETHVNANRMWFM